MEHPKNRLAEKISNGAETFTPSDRIIADYLLRAYPLSLLQNASEIADELSINTTTVTRFFRKSVTAISGRPELIFVRIFNLWSTLLWIDFEHRIKKRPDLQTVLPE